MSHNLNVHLLFERYPQQQVEQGDLTGSRGIRLSDVKFGLVVHEEPAKESLYLKAGAPTRCRACQKPFEGVCIRGDDDRYYCSEVCAQVGLEVDFDKVANLRKHR